MTQHLLSQIEETLRRISITMLTHDMPKDVRESDSSSTQINLGLLHELLNGLSRPQRMGKDLPNRLWG